MTTTTTTDAKGRALSFKPLSLLEEMDLIEIAGDAASNARWMMIARLAVMVRDVDGVPCPTPLNRKFLRQHIEYVGSEGIDAVALAFAETLTPPASPDQPQATGGELETAKN